MRSCLGHQPGVRHFLDRPLRLLAAALAALVLVPAAGAGGELARGQKLYNAGCVWCHGAQLQGVDRAHGKHAGPGGNDAEGPALLGVGAESADFYLGTGYMPLRDPRSEPHRRRSPYDARDLRALVAYVASYEGPPVPTVHPERGRTSEGLTLFTESCAGCHQIVGAGGVVTGARVPSLQDATPRQIAEAVRIGPYLMPHYTERDLSTRQLDSIVRYVLYARNPRDPGGWAIGRVGPVPEGLVAWIIAGVALLVVSRLIGGGLTKR